jgi:hypothetical protein
LSLLFSIFIQFFVYISHLSNSCYMVHPSKSSWFWSTSNLLESKMFEAPHYVIFFVLLLSSLFIDPRPTSILTPAIPTKISVAFFSTSKQIPRQYFH